jgi:hypothetical protein
MLGRYGRCLPDGTISCAACAKYFKPKQECHYCKGMFYVVGRNLTLGILEPACRKCTHKLGSARQCGGCHRPRVIAGERDGKGFCAACLPTGHPPVIECVDCHQRKYHFGAGRCEDCAWARVHAREMRKLLPQIRDLWARELFEDFCKLMQQTGIRHGFLGERLRRDVAFFSALSMNFRNKSELTGLLIIRRLGHEMIRRHERAISFLNTRNIVDTYDDPDYELELYLSRIRRIMEGQSPWVEAVLKRFLTHLLRVRDRVDDLSKRHRAPTRPKSIESAVRSALALLNLAESHQVQAVNELSQDHLDLLLGVSQRYRLSCASFVRYLNKNETLFKKLRIPSRNNSINLRGLLTDARRTDLIEHFGKATERADVHWALAALFTLVYAQPTPRIVRMRLSQVREVKGGGHEIMFTNVWLELDTVTSSVLSRWLATERREWSAFERTGTSDYLFPGKHAGSHADAQSFHNWLQKNGRGATARSLMATSLAGWISSSLNTHAVIIEALGVSRATASKYAEALGVQEAKMAKSAMSSQRARRR